MRKPHGTRISERPPPDFSTQDRSCCGCSRRERPDPTGREIFGAATLSRTMLWGESRPRFAGGASLIIAAYFDETT